MREASGLHWGLPKIVLSPWRTSSVAAPLLAGAFLLAAGLALLLPETKGKDLD